MFPYSGYSYYNPLYDMKEWQYASIMPLRAMLHAGKEMYGNVLSPMAYGHSARTLSATFSVLERITRDYPKPEFDITECEIEGRIVPIQETVVDDRGFCRLLHFRKVGGAPKRPKLLIVAPMAGHYATLCRGTVQSMLPFADVYITDWKNARDVHITEGSFTLDDYIDYLLDFYDLIGPEFHVLAVCQPVVPVMAAVAIKEAEHAPNIPRSMTLIGGPIDARRSPTEVNNFAVERSIMWFERNLITRVPYKFNGYMRPVYPGFIQLAGFMAMNLNRHVGEHLKLFQHLVQGDGDSAEEHKKFYNEYLAVMDLPAEFYLQTVEAVFQDYSLPKRQMVSRGRKVDPHAITRCWLLAIEGERDDIAGIGQTKASVELCKNLAQNKKEYRLQKDVGHYGLFNGRRFRERIVPQILGFMEKAGGEGGRS